ncbi:MAG: peptidoglycan DD-metalloendopeptidase family protein [Bacteroidales bacterium]|nr:peptidoglycan DD-metalloendopeptidase family protein [Bacteroidales bacterium]
MNIKWKIPAILSVRNAAIILAVILLHILYAPLSSAQNTKTQESRKARLEKEIEILDRQIKENSVKSSSALSNLSLLGKKISDRKELIAESDKQIASYESSIKVKQSQVNLLGRRLDTLSFYYSKLVRSAYKNRDARVWYMYMLSSENLGQAFRRISYLRDFSKKMNEQALKIKQTESELEKETAKLEYLKKKSQEIRAVRVTEINSLQKEQQESQRTINQLKRNRSKFQRDLTAKRRQVEALNREIERIIKKAMEEKAASSSSKSGTSKSSSKHKATIDYKLAGEFAANKGKLPWPAEGPVVDHFGQHYHQVFTRVLLPFNNGVTIALDKGTEIKSVFNGVVSQIVVIPGYNKCVLVQHGNYFSFYCKLKSVSVKAGDSVRTGQSIGVVDTINGETQLHFQIWSGRSPQNPELWLRPM